jgi:hypothetical protein
MPAAGFEHAIPGIEQVQIYAFDGRATRIRPPYITHLNSEQLMLFVLP